MTFDNLTDVEFEEFCYDLLNEMGLQKVDWRKGTGKKTSSADSGRDIECEYCRYDAMLQRNITEKWFVECKHYKSGVPFDKLSGAFSWAEAENPDRLIIFVSNFLSNSCKDAIRDYIDKRKPKFKVEIWERPFVEKKACMYQHILKKYEIDFREQFFDSLHTNHIQYIKDIPYNSLKQLFKAFDTLPYGDLGGICQKCEMVYVQNVDEYINLTPEQSITLVKKKIEAIAKCTSEQFAIQSFVNIALNLLKPIVSAEEINDLILRNQNLLPEAINFKDKIEAVLKKEDPAIKFDFSDEHIASLIYRTPDEIKSDVMAINELYYSFCDNVVAYLLEHDKIKMFKLKET